MRTYPLMYPGDGIVQPGTVPGSNLVNATNGAASRECFVRSNIRAESALKPGIDAAVPKQRAGAWFASKLKPYYEALVRKFERAGEAEMEHYLAASQNLADLEQRIRRYERMQSGCY